MASITLRMRTRLSLIGRLVIVLALAAVVLVQFTATNDLGRQLNDSLNPACDAVQGLALAQVSASADVSDYALYGTKRSRAQYEHQIERADVLLTQIADQFAPGDEIIAMVDHTRMAQQDWIDTDAAPTIAARDNGDATGAIAISGSAASMSAFRAMNIATQDLHHMLTTRQQAAAERLLTYNRLLGALLIITALAMLIMIVTYFVSVRRWILRPLERMGQDLRLATESANHLHPIDGSGPPELAAVAVDAEALRRRLVAEIDEAQAARSGLDQDAPVVAALRRTMATPALPANELVSISGRMSAAEGVIAGDWWDVVLTRSGHVGVVVADVSGHGPAAGVTAVQVRALLRAALQADASPDSALRLAGEALTGAGNFVTAIVLLFTRQADAVSIRWANAGHLPAVLVHADGRHHVLEPTGPLLSALGGQWSTQQVTLAAGDLLLGYTDGLVERRDGTDLEPADLARILGESRSHANPDPAHADPAEALERLLATVRAGSSEWSRDDVTAVVIAPR